MSKNQIDLAVLAVRDNAANCKILKTNEKIILRLSSYQLFKIVPGEIATIDPKKQWEFGNNKYISGKLINHRIDIPALGLSPLKLKKFDYWDPLEAFEEKRDEYDEIIEETDEYYKAIIQAGKRLIYEMEQIVPGDTDLNADGPILDAIYYKDIGEIGTGQDILMDEIIMDLRCLDAHAHLGNFIFDNRPEKARRVSVNLYPQKSGPLSDEEIKIILRGADDLIMEGGRSLLAKILKGSRDKTILEKGLNSNPAYGYYRDLSIYDITSKIDWLIINRYLEIEYRYRLPMLVYSPKGWEIEKDTDS